MCPGVPVSKSFLLGDVNITLIIRFYFKCWLLQMCVKSSSSQRRGKNVFDIFQNSSWFEGKREKGMGGSRRDKGKPKQKKQSKELEQAECEHREPEIRKSV